LHAVERPDAVRERRGAAPNPGHAYPPSDGPMARYFTMSAMVWRGIDDRT
jgi:hypothetical protein